LLVVRLRLEIEMTNQFPKAVAFHTHLKRLLFGFLRKLGPPQQVGRRRYYLGLILFMVPVLMTWAEPYVAILGREACICSRKTCRSNCYCW
jgi:hypothetical protein